MKKILLGISFIIASLNTNSQAVGIGTNSPASSSLLDISSTTKGMLIPRMTSAQRTAIASPANGLMVYDINTNSFWFYNGSAWGTIAGSASFSLPYNQTVALTSTAFRIFNNEAFNAIEGESADGYGVYGKSTGSSGVRGTSVTSSGIYGNSFDGYGVNATSTNGYGLFASSNNSYGIYAMSPTTSAIYAQTNNSSATVGAFNLGSGIGLKATSSTGIAIEGTSTGNVGVKGVSNSAVAIDGTSTSNTGVRGSSTNGIGVYGLSVNNVGTQGISTTETGVLGISYGAGKAGVRGEANSLGGNGVYGTTTSATGYGVHGYNASGTGVLGSSNTSTGVYGSSISGTGLIGYSTSGTGLNASSISGTGLYASSTSGLALNINGNLKISGGNTNPSAGAVLTSDASGNATWKTNKVGFHVQSAENSAIPHLQYTKIEFSDEKYDAQNNFTPYAGSTTSGSSKFTAPVAGLYHFSSHLSLFVVSFTNNITMGEIVLVINGNPYAKHTGSLESDAFSSDVRLAINVTVHLNAGDAVWIECRHSNEESTPVGVGGFPHDRIFSGHLIYAD